MPEKPKKSSKTTPKAAAKKAAGKKAPISKPGADIKPKLS